MSDLVLGCHETLKAVRVPAAIAANITCFVWLRRAVNNPEARTYTLGAIRRMVGARVNPSYAVAGITGLRLIRESQWEFTTPWVMLSIVMYLAMMALDVTAHDPLMRRQIRLVDTGTSTGGRTLSRRR